MIFVKNWRISKIYLWATTDLWMLLHDTDSWSETKDSLLLIAIVASRVSSFLCQFPEPQFQKSDANGVSDIYTLSGCTPERTAELR